MRPGIRRPHGDVDAHGDGRGSGRVTGGGVDCSGPATCTAEEPRRRRRSHSRRSRRRLHLHRLVGEPAREPATRARSRWMPREASQRPSRPSRTSSDRRLSGNGNVSGGSGAINCGLGGEHLLREFHHRTRRHPRRDAGDRRDVPRLDGCLRRHGDDLHRLDEPVEKRHRDVFRLHAHRPPGSRSPSRSAGTARSPAAGSTVGTARPPATSSDRAAGTDHDPHRRTVQRRDVRRLGRRLLAQGPRPPAP